MHTRRIRLWLNTDRFVQVWWIRWWKYLSRTPTIWKRKLWNERVNSILPTRHWRIFCIRQISSRAFSRLPWYDALCGEPYMNSCVFAFVDFAAICGGQIIERSDGRAGNVWFRHHIFQRHRRYECEVLAELLTLTKLNTYGYYSRLGTRNFDHNINLLSRGQLCRASVTSNEIDQVHVPKQK